MALSTGHGQTAGMPDEQQDKPDKKQKHPHLHHLEEQAEKAVKDVEEFFEAGGDLDTPTSDSDTQASGLTPSVLESTDACR